MFICMAFVFFTFIYKPFSSQNDLKALNKCFNPSALWDRRTASSAKASKNNYNIAISRMYRFTGTILLRSKYSRRSGYTWSKNMVNSFGDAPSPYLTPVFISKLCYYYPLLQTTPLFSTYIFLISCIRLWGIFILLAISSHRILRSTRSYALFKSINNNPSGCFAHTLYYTSC
jgi:hypothetical protein